MIYGSVCSGIEAASVAWEPLGWKPAFFSEIEAFPRSVLAHRWPEVHCHGDFTSIEAGQYEPIDLLVGGTPCQSFSVAGLRGGLDDDRGNLALEYLRLADRLRPRWLVWENVPGVLSSNGGRDFGSILGGMVQLGYGVAYRVLDAQFFGVPQRRRRVFVVGCLGDWRGAAAVLFERHSLQGHPAPRREAGENVAPIISARPTGGGGLGTDFDCDGGLIPSVVGALACNTGPNGHDAGNFACNQAVDAGHLIPSTGHTAHCLNAGGMGRQDYETETLIAQSVQFDRRRSPSVSDVANALHSSESGTMFNGVITHAGSHANAGGQVAVAFGGDVARTLSARHDSSPCADRGQDVVAQGSSVRRLTPRECARLQGFPDDYLDVMHRGKPAADGPKYKALGNSFAVPVVRWIGERIAAVEALRKSQTLEAAA